MSTFRELLETSSIFRGVIAVAVISTLCYAVIAQIQPPDWWIAVGSGIMSYYFSGALANQTARNTLRAHEAGKGQ